MGEISEELAMFFIGVNVCPSGVKNFPLESLLAREGRPRTFLSDDGVLDLVSVRTGKI